MRALTFDRVTVQYGRLRALAEASFVCAPGQVTCLAGPNGAGKSTALAVAAGVIAASSGRISLGADVAAPHRPNCGAAYLWQEGGFPKLLTAREILRFAASTTGARDSDWQTALRVAGIDQIIERRAGELSSGWLRRLGLAWTLLQPADVLLLDEPLAGLDPDTLDRLIEHVGQRAAAGNTVVMTTHEFEPVETLRPDLIVLDQGRVVSHFPAQAGGLRELYRSALTRTAADERAEASHA